MKYEDGSYYHVFNRGARRGPIFFNRGNYPYLLSLFKKYERESGVFLAAYCLMPNHYHLVIRQDAGGSISKFVQVVFNAYTQAVNLQQGLSGTLFQGKAKARYLDTDEYVLRVIRYVHLNPVRGGLVDQPEDWEFSDCREWISTSPLDRAKADFRKMYFFSGDDYRVFLRGVDEQIDMGRLSRYLFTEGSEGTSRGLLEGAFRRSHGNAPEPSEGLVDLNSDVGERSEALADGSEEELLKLITSANIACGGHAGNEETMERVVRLAIKHGVRIGAHPSFPDRENFGRREMNLTFDEIRAAVTEQVQALTVIAHKLNARIAHVKPHGALYNIAARNARVAHAIAAGVGEVDNSLILMGLAGSGMLGVWRELGFRVAAEAFADRVYEPDGSLRLRKFPDALITDPDRAAQQALSIARDGITTASDGSQLQIEAQTICIHSDTPNAVAIARAVRRVLETEGFRLKATEG